MTQKFNYVEHYKKDAEEFDYFEERTGATEHDERRVHEFIISNIVTTPKSILDVGSGSAWVAKQFSNNSNVVSLDLSKDNVARAKSIIPYNNHFPIVADSFKLPFQDNSFEYVIASEIIEHVINPTDFIKELYRVVKPKGALIVTTPYKEKLRFYLCIHCNNKTPVHAHIHSFDENKLLSYSPINSNVNWVTFGNKYLIFLRTYILLKHLTFKSWLLIDRLVNKLKSNPVHIFIQYTKI